MPRDDRWFRGSRQGRERADLAAALAPGRARPAGLQLPLDVAARRPRRVPRRRSGSLARVRAQPRPAAAGDLRGGAAAGGGGRLARRARRGARARDARGSGSSGGDRRGCRGAAGRVLLRRARGPRLAADLRGRARRARRRHPQGGLRSRAAVHRDRPDVSLRLLPPARRPHRLAAGDLGRDGPGALAGGARHGRRRSRPAARDGADRPGSRHGAGLAGGRRARALVPARHRPAGEHAGRPLDHGSPV